MDPRRRSPFVAGNWKMNLGLREAAELSRRIAEAGRTAVRIDDQLARGLDGFSRDEIERLIFAYETLPGITALEK